MHETKARKVDILLCLEINPKKEREREGKEEGEKKGGEKKKKKNIIIMAMNEFFHCRPEGTSLG